MKIIRMEWCFSEEGFYALSDETRVSFNEKLRRPQVRLIMAGVTAWLSVEWQMALLGKDYNHCLRSISC